MRAKVLAGVLGGYSLALALSCAVVVAHFRIRTPAHEETVSSVWNHGKLVARAVSPDPNASSPELEAARAAGGVLARERIVGHSALFKEIPTLLALSFVPGLDGLRARLGEKIVYLTPDDLLSHQIYDHGPAISSLSLTVGIDLDVVSAILGERFGEPPLGILGRVELERVRTVRSPSAAARPKANEMTRDDVVQSVRGAAQYLARAVQPDGRFRYLVDATTNDTIPGYSWPRHAGATFFLAQSAALTHDAAITEACLRAAEHLRQDAMVQCGDGSCIGHEAVVDLGSAALAALAFAEIVRSGLDYSFRPTLTGLSQFLRNQQRSDGEFMHQYLRYPKQPLDRQGLYYSSEAVLALGRIYRVMREPVDLEAASRGLAYLVGPGWSFFGDRYYFGEEHWTCQAMAELWPEAPNPKALDFCMRWSAFNRRLQQREGDAPFDSDGALGISPLITPRLTPIASRCEASVATLEVARIAGTDPSEVEALDQQMRHSLAFLLRNQFMPGPTHLFADPEAVHGAFPGSAVDWKLRIDYTQHAGSALVRWLEVTAPR